jgi:hypothetical protein
MIFRKALLAVWKELRDWRPPRHYLKEFAIFLAGTACIVVACMNGIAWVSVPHWSAFIVRALLVIIALFLAIRYISTWLEKHSVSIPPADPDSNADPVFAELSPIEVHGLVRATMLREGRPAAAEAASLAHDLIAPRHRRAKAVERIQITGRTAQHTVRADIRPAAVTSLASRQVVLVTRPMKGQHVYTDFVIVDGTGQQLPLLPLVSTAALLLGVCLSTMGDLADLPPAVREQLEADLTQLLLAPSWSPVQAVALYRGLLRSAHVRGLSGTKRRELSELLQVCAERRPMFGTRALISAEAASEIEFTYSEPVHGGFEHQPYEWWRERKDSLRRRLLFPPRLVFLSMERARSTQAYRMYVTAPSGLYIDEAGVHDSGTAEPGSGVPVRWLPNLERETIHHSYVGWQVPVGKSSTSLGAVNFAGTKYRRPYFCIRLMEIPPGSLGGAVVVAIAVVVTTWLSGALAPTDNDQNVDLVAFIIAFPGVMSSWLGLTGGSADRMYRSLSAYLSLGGSSLLSLLALVLYLGRHAGQQHIRNSDIWWDGKTILFIHDYLWILILFAALANFIATAGTLLMRLIRYRSQLLREP